MSNVTNTTKAAARAPFLTRTPRPEGLPEHFLCVRQAEAGKLGLRAHGNIIYQTLLDPERKRVFLRVIANSGSGSFSDEPVLVDKLAEAVANRNTSKPLRGSVLQTAIVGKSVCNAGFMAATLVAEGLLGREAGKRFDLTDLERWQAWMAEQRDTPGDLTEVRLKVEGVAPEMDKLVALSKIVKGKGLVITPVAANGTDANIDGPAGECADGGANADDQAQAGADADLQAGEAGATGEILSEVPSVPEGGQGSPEVDDAKAQTSKGRRRAKGKE